MSVLAREIDSLSVGQKLDLLDTLWQQIEAARPMLSDEQADELERRIETYDRGHDAVIPWDQVRIDLASR